MERLITNVFFGKCESRGGGMMRQMVLFPDSRQGRVEWAHQIDSSIARLSDEIVARTAAEFYEMTMTAEDEMRSEWDVRAGEDGDVTGSYLWAGEKEEAFELADRFIELLKKNENEVIHATRVAHNLLEITVYPHIDKLRAFREDAGRRLEALEALGARVAGLENREDKSLVAIDERLARLEARAGAEPSANGASANGGGLLELAVEVLEANRGAISTEQARRLQRITSEYCFDDIPF